ncbi:MAG: 6-phosphogluconolactonase [Candidatus Nealsonbacteria bacterium]
MEIKQIGRLEIRIFPDVEELSRHAAQIFISESKDAINKKGFFTVSLPGGRTPKRLFELLGTDFKGSIDWPKIHIFWGDELAQKGDPKSAFYLASQSWLNFVQTNVYRIKMELGLIEGAKEYQKEIEQWASAGFDLAFNGAGSDGHRNGIVPDHPEIGWKDQIWELPKNIKVWGYEAPSPTGSYIKKITLTPWFLNQSKVNILMLLGDEKAELLRKITVDRKKYNNREIPAITFNDVPTIVLLDEAAASKL